MLRSGGKLLERTIQHVFRKVKAVFDLWLTGWEKYFAFWMGLQEKNAVQVLSSFAAMACIKER